MTESTDRKTVSLGLDFRPVPVDVGDGKLWEFDPDPSPAKWDRLVNVMNVFVKNAEKDEDVPASEEETQKLYDELTEAVSKLLLSEEQQAEWEQRRYGMFAQRTVAIALMGELSGFPTESESTSGPDSEPTGSPESPDGTSPESTGEPSQP